MINQCIHKVYQRDKKVFIPEFGAIIYSEFNDEVDFNELLTFDDGKVIEEIQKQQSITEEQARKALEKYVREVKATVEKGKSHNFEGIGYLSRDKQGALVMQKGPTNSDVSGKSPEASIPTTSEENIADPAKVDEKIEEVEKDEINHPDSGDLFEEEATDSEFPRFENTPIFPDVDNDEDETVFSVEEEKQFGYEYEEELKIDESESSSGSGLKTAFLIIIPILLIAAGAYYYFNLDKSDTTLGESSKIQSVESIPEKDVLESTEDATESVDSEKTDNTPVRLTSSSSTSQIDEDKTFCLIMGSFKVERNADKYQRRLKQKGLDSNKFKGRKNFYFVGIQSIKGKSNAVKQLDEIKSKVPSAWIYNKDLLL